MVAPFDPSKPLAGTSAEGYLRAQISESEFLEKSGTSLLEELRGFGLEIRTQRFFDIRRDVLGLRKYEEQIKSLREDTRVPRAWVDDTLHWDTDTDFLYRIEVTGLDPNTGESITRYMSRGMDREHPVGNVEADLISLVVDEVVPYDIIITGALVYQVLAREGVLQR